MGKKLIIIIVLMVVNLLYSQSQAVRQRVRSLPTGYDTTGIHRVVYDKHQPTARFLTETSIGSYYSYVSPNTYFTWYVDVGNFQTSPPWSRGDTVISFGSWDSAFAKSPGTYSTNPNHTGFYWLFCDTLFASSPYLTFTPEDTLRPMPQPVASQLGSPTYNVEIKIPNPRETRRGDGSYCGGYHVLGYWLWADTTALGTPSTFNKEVGFFPVTGAPGDTTNCSHSPIIYRDQDLVRWAYKIVSVPDTHPGSRQISQGYTTYYSSQNSGSIVVTNPFNVEEKSQELKPENSQLEISPNPFKNATGIKFQIPNPNDQTKLNIYDITGKLVKSFSLSTHYSLLATSVEWNGTDDVGRKLPAGVYFVRLSDYKETKTVVLLK